MQKNFKLIQLNWKSGVTVSLVSIPLSLALAIASGATPTQGIITAFWAGLIGSFFGGSNYNIIGPTGALSGILITYSLTNGYASLPLIAILSGFFILIAYFLHLDKYIIFIPRSVVHGFTLGVAFIIGFGQINNIFGLDNLPKQERLIENIIISFQHLANFQWIVFLIFIIGTFFVLFWNKKFPKIPGAILLTISGILFSWILSNYWHTNFHLNTLGEIYPEIQATVYVNIWKNLSFSSILNKEIWIISLATALISILETLISGQIADSLTQTKFKRSKEVLSLGLANLASGFFGGIPATAALARTALNIKSGASHKISGIINSFCILLIAFLFFPYFKLLPMVVIASILVVVAIAMVEKKHFVRLLDNEKTAFALSLFVALITFIEDPIIGILVGTFIALLIFVNKVAYGQTEILIWRKSKLIESLLKHDFIKRSEINSDLIVYKISGTLTYVNMPAHIEAVQKIKNNQYVIISLRHAFYADSDGISYLEEIIETLKKYNQKVILSGINQEVEKLIKKEEFYKKKLIEGKIYSRTSEAIKAIYKN